MDSATHFSIQAKISNKTADVPSSILRTALPALSFASDRRGVDGVRWFHDNSSRALPNLKEFSVHMTFGFSDGRRNFRKTLFRLPRSFCFAQVTTASIEWQDLVPRLRIDDWGEIPLRRWGLCDRLHSNNQISLPEVLFSSSSSSRRPLWFWFV